MSVFDDLRSAFREAVHNFKEELERDAVPEKVDRLLRGMVEEVTEAKARLAGIEAQLQTAREQVAEEEEQVATMRRREEMARDIGDEETAGLAAQYGERHEKRLQVFRQKSQALTEEAALLRSEVEEMMAKVKEARGRRESLAAEAGRTGARERLGESNDLFEALERMEERIEHEAHEGEAARTVGGEFDDLRVDPWAPPRKPEIDFDAALAELKRRMGKE